MNAYSKINKKLRSERLRILFFLGTKSDIFLFNKNNY